MKASTLIQPWATLVAIGAKRFETRSWCTSYRGLLAIHAAKAFPRQCQWLVDTEPFASALGDMRRHLPIGKIIAVAELKDCKLISSADLRQCGFEDIYGKDRKELAFGDYTVGRYAWELADVEELAVPIDCKGALSLWDVPAAVEFDLRHKGIRQ